MTHRLKILIAVFLFLVALVIFSLYTEDTGEVTVRRDVAVEDTASVSRIVFIKPKEGEVSLKKSGNNGIWRLNGKYEVRSYLKNLLLTGLNKLEVKREVSESKRPELIKQMKVSGYLVKLYDENDVLMEEFYISPNENDPNSAYYLPDNTNEPYIVYVPGFEGSIVNLFALNENDWREKIYFTSTSRNLQKVSIEYPDFPEQSFKIVYQNGEFSLLDGRNIDSTRLRAYLSTYKVLTVNNYIEGGKAAKDNLFKQSSPLAVMEVKSLTNSVSIQIYEDKGKLFGYFPEENEFVSLNPQLYNRLLVKRDFFKKKSGE